MGEFSDISKRIKELRNAKGLTQEQLADALGVDKVAVSQWERGVRQPKTEYREALCDYFNVNMDYLLGNWDHIDRLLTEDEMLAVDNIRKNGGSEPSYYWDSETREAADFLFHNPEYRVLFDATRKVRPEDIDFVRQMIDRMKGNDDY